MAKQKKSRLGRGLSSLMSAPVSLNPPAEVDATPEPPAATPPAPVASAPVDQPKPPAAAAPPAPADPVADADRIRWVPVTAVEPNPYQPRRTFDEASLDELAESIRQAGVMQPIILRPSPGAGEEGRYQLVAGERRWRAAQRADLETVPAIVRTLDDQTIAEWAVIENLQREDLNAIDKAEAFARLIGQFSLRHEDVAERVGINRVTVTNLLRLLDLSGSTQELIRLDKLSAGHGRAIATLDDPATQDEVARRAVAQGWSVRQVEQTVKRLSQPLEAPTPKKDTRAAHYSDLERSIGSQLKTKVRIKPGRKKGTGTLEIEFHGLDAFDDLLERLSVRVD